MGHGGDDDDDARERERCGVRGGCARSERVATWSSDGRRTVLGWSSGLMHGLLISPMLCVTARGRAAGRVVKGVPRDPVCVLDVVPEVGKGTVVCRFVALCRALRSVCRLFWNQTVTERVSLLVGT